jgi:hypothetical protein
MIHFDAKHQTSEAKTKENKRKLSEKIEAKRKLSKKSKTKRKKSEKNEKIDLNFASLCFASKQNYYIKAKRKI